MKTILVLTDFSKNAAHASRVATRLAEKMHAGILLWNCYLKIPIVPGYIGGTSIAQIIEGNTQSRELLERKARDLQDYLTISDGSYRPSVNTRFREGGMKQALVATLAEQHFEMIVMGASSECAVEHAFIGSHTLFVIEHANCPVLIVPPRAHLEEIDKIVFATNFDMADLTAITNLQNWSAKLDFSIEIVHITINNEKDTTTIEKEALFNRQLKKLKGGEIQYREIRGKEVVNRLNRMSIQTRADILSMTHHQYSFFRKLFSDSVTKAELSKQKIPLLIFPIALKTP